MSAEIGEASAQKIIQGLRTIVMQMVRKSEYEQRLALSAAARSAAEQIGQILDVSFTESERNLRNQTISTLRREGYEVQGVDLEDGLGISIKSTDPNAIRACNERAAELTQRGTQKDATLATLNISFSEEERTQRNKIISGLRKEGFEVSSVDTEDALGIVIRSNLQSEIDRCNELAQQEYLKLQQNKTQDIARERAEKVVPVDSLGLEKELKIKAPDIAGSAEGFICVNCVDEQTRDELARRFKSIGARVCEVGSSDLALERGDATLAGINQIIAQNKLIEQRRMQLQRQVELEATMSDEVHAQHFNTEAHKLDMTEDMEDRQIISDDDKAARVLEDEFEAPRAIYDPAEIAGEMPELGGDGIARLEPVLANAAAALAQGAGLAAEVASLDGPQHREVGPR